jgi:hypothetical protein
MTDPYISEVKYLGGASLDFIEIVVDGGTDVSDITVTVYNSDGTVRSVNLLGTSVATIAGNDVYLVNTASSATFNGLNKKGAVSIDTAGTVHQFISFDDGPPVTASAGAANGTTSTQIGLSGGGNSLETNDGGLTYFTQTSPNSGTVPCFVRGTHIQTAEGPKKVEDLRVGDLLENQSGEFVPAQLILSSKVSPRDLDRNPNLNPVCLTADCLGPGLPARDLLVSPQHRFLISSSIVLRMFGEPSVLVAAIRLTVLPGIFQLSEVSHLEYFHVVTAQHEILVSEGLHTESFLIGPEVADTLNPEQLRELSALFPDVLEPCAVQPPAHLIPDGKLQKKLMMRHAKNNRSIVPI